MPLLFAAVKRYFAKMARAVKALCFYICHRNAVAGSCYRSRVSRYTRSRSEARATGTYRYSARPSRNGSGVAFQCGNEHSLLKYFPRIINASFGAQYAYGACYAGILLWTLSNSAILSNSPYLISSDWLRRLLRAYWLALHGSMAEFDNFQNSAPGLI